jgi:hypothetical protein
MVLGVLSVGGGAARAAPVTIGAVKVGVAMTIS